MAPETGLTVAWAGGQLPTTPWQPTQASLDKQLRPEAASQEFPDTTPASGEEASSSLPAAGSDYPWL